MIVKARFSERDSIERDSVAFSNEMIMKLLSAHRVSASAVETAHRQCLTHKYLVLQFYSLTSSDIYHRQEYI